MNYFQQIINFLYRYPKSKLQLYKKFGGYLKYRKMMQGRKDMMASSNEISPILSHEDGYPIYFLTGKNYFFQTIFCIKSLVNSTSAKFHFILVDDGTFDELLIAQIEKQLPNCLIITQAEIKANLNQFLPASKFPYLHKKRKEYPHIKKLTDIHTIQSNDFKLVLDSDMLFWAEPQSIIDWLKNPQKPIHMVDCIEAYGYSDDLMQNLTGYPITKKINVGAIGFNSRKINWEKLELWCRVLEDAEGASYYLEQALTAMIICGSETEALSGKYLVNPKLGDVNNSNGILHHYVDISRQNYFNIAWKKLKNELR